MELLLRSDHVFLCCLSGDSLREVAAQAHALYLEDVAMVCQKGYALRVGFKDFLERFSALVPEGQAKGVSPASQCVAVLKPLAESDNDFKVGRTKVLVRRSLVCNHHTTAKNLH